MLMIINWQFTCYILASSFTKYRHNGYIVSMNKNTYVKAKHVDEVTNIERKLITVQTKLAKSIFLVLREQNQ